MRILSALVFIAATTPALAQTVSTRIVKFQSLKTPIPAPPSEHRSSVVDSDSGLAASNTPGYADSNVASSIYYFELASPRGGSSPTRPTPRPTARGAALNLLLPDGRIAQVKCNFVPDWTILTERYRDCHTPPSTSTPVQAQFHGKRARLTWPSGLPNPNAKPIKETYTLVSITPPAPKH
jgi:hypothetical protein